ncbi:unnamed protein product [Schistocephalus solidus]|uniref:XK-related protein n=1 Tax=Schistocephalus solidus TaxID=70667 RepID=A0A183TAP1_SCHSO|nr:unnamed protein product [Schistocephalus solidus]
MSGESEHATGCTVQDFMFGAVSLALTFVQLLCFIGLALLHDASYRRLAMNSTVPETVPATNRSVHSALELGLMLSLIRSWIHLPGIMMAWSGAVAVLLSRTAFWCARGIYRWRPLRVIFSHKSQVVVFLSNAVAVLGPFTVHFLLLIHLILSLILLSIYANFSLCDSGLAQPFCNWLLLVSTTTLLLSAIGTSASFFGILRIQREFHWCRRFYQLPKLQRTSVTATGTCYTYPMHKYCRYVFRRVRNPQTAEMSTSTAYNAPTVG